MDRFLERLNSQSPLLLKGFLFGLWVALPAGTLENRVVSMIVVGYLTFEFVIAVRTLRNQGVL